MTDGQDQNHNPNPTEPLTNPDGTTPTPASAGKKTRKPRADKGKAKVKAKAKSVRMPVISMRALVAFMSGANESVALKAMTATGAEAEILKLAGTKDNAEKYAGAKIQIVALVDSFAIDSEFKVTVSAKR